MNNKQKKKYSDAFIEDYIENRGRSEYSITAELLDEKYLDAVYKESIEDTKPNTKEFVLNDLTKEDKATILSHLVRNINSHVTVEDYERIQANTKTEEQSFRVIDEFGPTAYFFLPTEQQQNKNLIVHYLDCARGLPNHDAEEFFTYNKIPPHIFNDLEFLEKAVQTDVSILAEAPEGSKGKELFKGSKNHDVFKMIDAMKMSEELQASLTRNAPQNKTKKLKM